jgi:hypothetical protein
MLDPHHAGLGWWQGRVAAAARLNRGLLIGAADVLVPTEHRFLEDPLVQVQHDGGLAGKLGVARKDPRAVLPWFDRVLGQTATTASRSRRCTRKTPSTTSRQPSSSARSSSGNRGCSATKCSTTVRPSGRRCCNTKKSRKLMNCPSSTSGASPKRHANASRKAPSNRRRRANSTSSRLRSPLRHTSSALTTIDALPPRPAAPCQRLRAPLQALGTHSPIACAERALNHVRCLPHVRRRGYGTGMNVTGSSFRLRTLGVTR